MTVGVPETSLDTWGLRYVKKLAQGEKKVENTQGKQPTPTSTDQFLRDDESKLQISAGRQNDSSGDTTGRYAATGQKVGEQTHKHPAQPDKLGGRKVSTTTQGRASGEGATGATVPVGQSLTSEGKIGGKTDRVESKGTGSKGRNLGDPSTDPTHRHGHEIKPAKQGEGVKSKTPKGSLIQRAEMDLAIIKCKILKMKSKKKDFIEEGRPTRPAYRKDDDEDTKEAKKDALTGKQSKDSKPEEEGTEYSPNEKHQLDNPANSYAHYKSNDIVDKAIELINEAYDEMNKAHELGEEDKQSDFQWHKADSSDLLRTDTSERTAGGKMTGVRDHDQKYGDSMGKKETSSERVGRADNIENRPTNEYNKDRKIKGAYDEMKSDGFKKLKPTYEGDTKQAKKDAPSTTSSEGSANFVYSDVKEAEKQKQ